MAMTPNQRRKFAHGSNALVMTTFVVLLIGLLVGIADRNRVLIDLSSDTAPGVSSETVQKLEMLNTLDARVRITAFTHQDGKTGSYFKNRSLKDFLQTLGYESSRVEWNLVDFDRERLTAESFGVKEYGRMVLQKVDSRLPEAQWSRVDIRARDLFRTTGRGPERRHEFLGESVVNRSLSQLLSDQKQTLYSLVGHREKNLKQTDGDGLSGLVELMGQENYELLPLNLFEDTAVAGGFPRIPEDADGLVIASPKTPLLDAEEAAVLDFVARGGALLILLDPGASVPGILTRLDIGIHDGVVMDEKLVFPYNDRPVPRYRHHPIVEELEEEQVLTVLSHIAPLRAPGDPPPWLKVASILEASRTGWIERGGESRAGVAVFNPEIDAYGPTQQRPSAPIMAMAVELRAEGKSLVSASSGGARILVVGDSNFATNQVLSEGPGNAPFLINAFRWLLRDDDRLGGVAVGKSLRKITLSSEDHARLRWLVLGLMPFLTALAGVLVWSSRRGR